MYTTARASCMGKRLSVQTKKKSKHGKKKRWWGCACALKCACAWNECNWFRTTARASCMQCSNEEEERKKKTKKKWYESVSVLRCVRVLGNMGSNSMFKRRRKKKKNDTRVCMHDGLLGVYPSLRACLRPYCVRMQTQPMCVCKCVCAGVCTYHWRVRVRSLMHLRPRCVRMRTQPVIEVYPIELLESEAVRADLAITARMRVNN